MKKAWSEMTHLEREEFNRFQSSKEINLDRCIEFLRSFGAYDHWADEIERLRTENETLGNLQDVLIRNGFVRCDIPACNCGSWHAKYGLPERWYEVKTLLEEAGHPLCNENGHLVRKTLSALIAERDNLRAAIQKVLDDEENGEGVWGPEDVTVCDYLAAALKGTS